MPMSLHDEADHATRQSRAAAPALGGERRVGGKSLALRESIGGTDNNYTLIRVFLAASVIYYHSFWLTKATGHFDYASALLLPIASVGGLAVQAFFFLSGLFVAQSYFRDGNALRFAVKRALRIWPGLFFCLVVTSLLAGLVSRPHDFFSFLLFGDLYDYILKNAAFHLSWDIPGVFEGHRFTSLNGSIHTLPLEAKMYAVLTVVGSLGLLGTLRRLTVSGILLLIVTLLPPTFIYIPFNIFDADYSRGAAAMFFSGVVAYGLSGRIRLRAWHGLVLIAPLLLTTGALHVALYYLLMMWALIVLGQSTWLRRIWRPRHDVSYGIYLYGWPCQQIIVHLYPEVNPYLLSTLAIPLATLFALISWKLVEAPAIAFGHSLAGKSPLRPLAGGSAVSLLVRQFSPTKNIALVAGLFAICIGMSKLVSEYDFVPVIPLNARIVDFGPHSARVGEGINVQPNGESGVWITLDATPPAGTKVVFDGELLETQIGSNLVTAKVGEKLLSRRGGRNICLELRKLGRIERSNCVVLQLI